MRLIQSSWCTRDLAALGYDVEGTDVALLNIVGQVESKFFDIFFEHAGP